MRRLWLAVLLLAALVLSGVPAGAEEAASEDVVPAASVQAPVDFSSLVGLFDDGGACTGVPDAIPPIFDFTASCEQHDACYAQGVDRLGCDLAFRENMVAQCETQHPDALDANRYACLTFAELYFLGVRLFGGSFFPTS